MLFWPIHSASEICPLRIRGNTLAPYKSVSRLSTPKPKLLFRDFTSWQYSGCIPSSLTFRRRGFGVVEFILDERNFTRNRPLNFHRLKNMFMFLFGSTGNLSLDIYLHMFPRVRKSKWAFKEHMFALFNGGPKSQWKSKEPIF